MVDSDMAMLHQPLALATVTFQQDSSEGTRTTLHLVEPYRLGKGGGANIGAPQQQTGQATAPPKAAVADPPPETLPPG